MLTCRPISTATKRYPHLYVAASTAHLSCLVLFYCPVHAVGRLTVLIECRDNCQDIVDSARSNCLFGILDPQNSRIALREDGRLYPIVSRETIVVTINIAANFARACLRLIDFRFMALCLAPPDLLKRYSYEIVIDVSDLDPIGYDDLDAWREVIDR